MRNNNWRRRLACPACGVFVLALLLAAFPAPVTAQPSIEALKAAMDLNGGTLKPLDVITYTVTITNTGTVTQADDATRNELEDPIPANATYNPLVPATATSGTVNFNAVLNRIEWNGTVAAPGAVIIIYQVVVNPGVPDGTAISNQGIVNWDADGNGVSESVEPTDDPATPLAGNDPTVLRVGESQAVRATKTVTDTSGGRLLPGDTLQYNIILTNTGPAALADNAGHELVDGIPANTAYVEGSASASAGTVVYNPSGNEIVWDGIVSAPGAVSISFQVTVDVFTPDLTIISNQGTHNFDSGGTSTNDASQLTDDPGTPVDGDPTNITVSILEVTAVKTVTDLNGGNLVDGDTVQYDIVLRNGEAFALADNTGNELIDTIPADTTYVDASVTATAGAAAYNGTLNRIEWNGVVPAGGQVAVSFLVTVDEGTASDTLISNQGVHSFDTDSNGTNDAIRLTDDPALPGTADATTITANPTVTNRWYLAEGCTSGGFETFVLVQNPGTTAVHVNLLFLTDQGEMSFPGLQNVEIPAASRATFPVHEYVQTYYVSTVVESSDGEVICERAVYWGDRAGGHASIGVTAPASTWYLAEGCTDGGFETFVLVQNPGVSEVHVSLTLQTDQGPRIPLGLQNQPVPARGRVTFPIHDYIQTYEVSTTVSTVEPGAEVVCERAMYWNGRKAGHDSVGVTASATDWYLAEGATAGGFETWVLVQNPGLATATVNLLLQTETGQLAPTGLQNQQIPAGGRRTFPIHDYVQSYDVSTYVQCSDGNVICERAMYWNGRNGGHNSIGVTATATAWYLAEGCTDGGFQTWVLVQNPGAADVHVNVKLQTGEGEVVPTLLQNVTVPAGGRVTLPIHLFITSSDVSTYVECTDGQVIAERAVYWNAMVEGTDSIGVPAP